MIQFLWFLRMNISTKSMHSYIQYSNVKPSRVSDKDVLQNSRNPALMLQEPDEPPWIFLKLVINSGIITNLNWLVGLFSSTVGYSPIYGTWKGKGTNPQPSFPAEFFFFFRLCGASGIADHLYQKWVLPPGKLTCPLEINGWKMYSLLK